MHFAVKIIFQPCGKACPGFPEVDPAESDGRKPELQRPESDFLLDRIERCTELHESLSLHLKDESETAALGGKIAPILHPGLTVYLEGQLGAGKTALARSILKAMGYAGKVKSPTYALVELYTISRLNLYHFDLYRFEDPAEWVDSGFREYFNPESICIVEWPEKGGAHLPGPDIRISLDIEGDGRHVEIIATSEAGGQCLMQLRSS